MAVFGGISGSAVADPSSIGSLLIPMMTESGYGKDFSVAVTVTSSCQGVMIPPSHNMILFAMAAMGLNLFLLNFPSPQGARTGKGAEKRRNRCRFTLAAVFFCGFMRRKRGTRLAW